MTKIKVNDGETLAKIKLMQRVLKGTRSEANKRLVTLLLNDPDVRRVVEHQIKETEYT